ncbi:hypothetical protein HOY80DRAFT_1116249 [Tuber brumale]|nr:hypothetical protein HOY80DRAFT_1116249 [Tuber brumale]
MIRIPLPVFSDNQANVHNANIGEHQTPSKTVSVKFHGIHDEIRDGTITVSHIPITDMTADGFTKIYGKIQQAELVVTLGLVSGWMSTASVIGSVDGSRCMLLDSGRLWNLWKNVGEFRSSIDDEDDKKDLDLGGLHLDPTSRRCQILYSAIKGLSAAEEDPSKVGLHMPPVNKSNRIQKTAVKGVLATAEDRDARDLYSTMTMNRHRVQQIAIQGVLAATKS